MTRILDIVDMQGDFMKKSGILYVPNSDVLVSRANDFFKALPKDAFDLALFKYDTHFADEYKHSPEAAWFPLHCEYGTEGWGLVVDPDLLAGKMPIHYMAKNTFDMWDKNPLPRGQNLLFKDTNESLAYANLHNVTQDRKVVATGVLRKVFMDSLSVQGLKGVDVTMIGVASNFCDHDAMLGYLAGGASVTVVEDLVAGLQTTVPGRAPSGDIREVITLPDFQPYVNSGKLKLATMTQVLQGLRP